MTGLCLAHYRIEAELGRGGMGIVYRAFDTDLDRTVALKVLPPHALASSEDRERFYREAKAAAQLHHPHIATVFQIGEAVPIEDGSDPRPGAEPRLFIAMEFIDGETLAERIAKAPLPLGEAVSIATQVAEALRTAHAKHIVHRDVKSANVMLTGDGTAKVLDFGLAKTNQSTMLTRQGSTLGTVSYMSPEQARGQEVDGRTDLYALGTVLYEMVAGRLPFAGDYEQAILYAILNEPPHPLTALRTGVPMELERITDKLLAKEAEHRYQTAADLVADLKSLDVSASGVSRARISAVRDAPPKPSQLSRLFPAAIGVLLLALGLLAGRWLASGPVSPDRPAMRLRVDLPEFADLNHPTMSSDGRYLAFTAAAPQGRSLVVHDLSTGSSSVLTDPDREPRLSRFSPGSEWLVYERGEGGLGIVQVPDGIPAALFEEGTNPTWLDPETIAFNLEGSIAVINRISREVTIAHENQVGTLNAIPGSDQILTAVFLPEGPQMAVFDVGSSSLTLLGKGLAPRLVPPGHILFQGVPETEDPLDDAPMFAQAYDPRAKALLGSAVEVLGARESWTMDVSEAGHLVFLPTGRGGVQPATLVRVDPRTGSGRPIEWTAPGDAFSSIGISGDGTWIAYAPGTRGASLFAREVDRPRASPVVLPFEEYLVTLRLSEDGTTLRYNRGSASIPLTVFSREADGSGAPRRVFEDMQVLMHDVSPDGRLWALTNSADNQNWMFGGLRFVDSVRDTETRVDSTVRVMLGTGRFSPDFRHFAFAGRTDSDVTGVYVVGRDGSGPWRIGEGEDPRWSAAGNALFVRRGPAIVRIDLDFSRGIRPQGTAEAVFESPSLLNFDVFPDGDVLAVSASSSQNEATGLELYLDWGRRLEVLAPRH